MFRNILGRLSPKRKSIEGPITMCPPVEETAFTISVTPNKSYTKVEISDYIRMQDYAQRIRTLDINSIANQISYNILWNNSRQRINKGTIYFFTHNNRLYNILVNDEIIEIDERTSHESSTDERIITLWLADNDYHYSSLKHNEIGSTYYTKYYSKKNLPVAALNLTQEEASAEIASILTSLETFDDIDTICPLNAFKIDVLANINNEAIQKKKD